MNRRAVGRQPARHGRERGGIIPFPALVAGAAAGVLAAAGVGVWLDVKGGDKGPDINRAIAPIQSAAARPMPDKTPQPPQSNNPVGPSPSPKSGTYVTHKGVKTSVAWIGKGIAKTQWESDVVKDFGGVDDPNKRGDVGAPKFSPNFNPYYVELPIQETPATRAASPWSNETSDPKSSLFKGRWIELQMQVTDLSVNKEGGHDKTTSYAYAQVLGGNAKHNDPAYVFDGKKPQEKSGITISPGVAYMLEGQPAIDRIVSGKPALDGTVTWEFVDQAPDDDYYSQAPFITNQLLGTARPI